MTEDPPLPDDADRPRRSASVRGTDSLTPPPRGGGDTVSDTTRSLTPPSAGGSLPRSVGRSPEGKPATGRFEVVGPIAEGGLGVVSMAVDGELGRIVALKQIREDRADFEAYRERFVREAEITGNLEHPGIVPVYGLGIDAEGRPYYAMRLIEGQTLKQAVADYHERFGVDAPWRRGDRRRRRQGESDANLALRGLVTRFLSICHTIAYAHSQGVVHRDLKPSNILLGPHGETLVVDWGLAKARGWPASAGLPLPERPFGSSDREGSSIELTSAGDIVGTPAFMSPEQASGDLDLIGPASDIYCLGATLYYLLTGVPPADGEVSAILQAVRAGEIVPPRLRNRAIPAALDAVCRKAMATRLADRYTTVDDLVTDIEHVLADEPVEAWAGLEPRGLRLARWERRNRLLLRTGSVALALVASVASISALALTRAWSNADTLRIKAQGAAQAETNQRNLAEQNLRQSQILAARLQVDQGLALCQSGELNLGLLTLAGSLERAESLGIPGLPALVRRNLAAWSERFLTQASILHHPDRVGSVAFAPLGERAATSCHDGKVRLWDPRTGALEATWTVGTRGNSNLVFTPDGAHLVVGRTSGEVTFWSVAEGKPKDVRIHHPRGLRVLALSPDGRLLATSGGPFPGPDPVDIRLWDARTGEAVGQPMTHPSGTAVVGLAFGPASDLLLSAGLDGEARLWRVPTGQALPEVIRHTAACQAVALDPTGQIVLTGGHDYSARLWNIRTGQPLGPVGMAHQHVVSSVAFTPDGQTALTASWDGSVRSWDARTGRAKEPPVWHAEAVGDVAVSPDGQLVLSSSNDRTARLWRLPPARDRVLASHHRAPVVAVRFAPDGRTFVTLDDAGQIQLWDAATAQPRGPLFTHPGGALEVLYSPDGRALISRRPPGSRRLGSDIHIMLWDLKVSPPRGIPLPHPAVVNTAAFSGDSASLLTLDNSGALRLWSIPDGTPQGSPYSAMEHLARLAVDGTGTIAAIGAPRSVVFFDLTQRRQVGTRLALSHTLTSLAFQPGHPRTVVTGDRDGGVRFWDIDTGEPARAAIDLADPISSLAFNGEGNRLGVMTGDILHTWDLGSNRPFGPELPSPGLGATHTLDMERNWQVLVDNQGFAQLWDLVTARELGPALPHAKGVTALALAPAPGGEVLISGDGQGSVRLWQLPRSLPLSIASAVDWAEQLTGYRLGTDGALRRRAVVQAAPPGTMP